jgi:hypothetical protein
MKPELRPPSDASVEREGERLAVEVPVRDDHVLFDEDERVIRRGVELDGHGVLDVRE